MQFYCTSSFKKSIKELCSKERNGYISCRKDIYDFFTVKLFEEIWITPILFKSIDNDISRIIKAKISNSGLKLGASNGFRLYFFVSKNTKDIVYITVYPKRGKFGKVNLKKAEIKFLLNKFVEEFEKNCLIKVNLNKELGLIEINGDNN